MFQVIADVHGYYESYIRLTRKYEHTIQIGDMGFNYQRLIEEVNPSNHRFFGGNHDNYDIIDILPHNLGDFGSKTLNGTDFFFVRGAFSIDVAYRRPHIEWWPNEQLSEEQFKSCLDLYQLIKPDLMLTHDAPKAITDMIGNPCVLASYGFDASTFTTRTQEFLQAMLDIHKPSMWVYGHHHVDREVIYKGCHFICLPELGTLQIN